MSRYFLSYSRSDETIALRFANDLIAAGVPVWVDQYDIRPSEHWDRAVETAVTSCEGMIVILSPRSAASPNVADEVSVALNRGKSIIPILVEQCTVPLRMTRMQFIDATSDYPRAVQRCLTEIGRKTAPADGNEQRVDVPPAALPMPKLPPAVTDAAIRRLTPLLGPIAAVLVRNAAAGAASEAELYESLASKIPNPSQRAAFTKLAAAPDRTALPPQSAATAALPPAPEIDRIVTMLTRHLGPIATHLVRREQQAAASASDLHARLAKLLPTDAARADFLKQLGAG